MPGIEGTMKEFKAGTLHSGSKSGPKVTSRKQAIAIAMHQKDKDTPLSIAVLKGQHEK